MKNFIEIHNINEQINKLPKGYISKKTISNKERYYLQWSENGKKKSKYIKENELDQVNKDIQLRKELESRLKELNYAEKNDYISLVEDFSLSLIYGYDLLNECSHASNFVPRHEVKDIEDYLHNNVSTKVLILYGLRRTGKTTMIFNTILHMNAVDFKRTAYIKIEQKNDMGQLKHDLKILLQSGFKYVFIDEITLMEDFIEGSAILSDMFVPQGLKIILSGADSLGFMFSSSDQLYDRAVFIHTTFLPYYEFEKVLSIKGIDNYIEYGGTMVIENTNYNKVSTFSNIRSTNQYIDSSIADNIQHSLKYYQYGSHFRHLEELYDNDELTNVINRIVEDMNHKFALNVIMNDFKSHDLGLAKNNLRKDISNNSDILDKIDEKQITNILKNKLNILNKNEQNVPILDIHITEIKQYLELLDLIIDIDIDTIPVSTSQLSKTVFLQPGLRYSQAKELIESLKTDRLFASLKIEESRYVIERILNEIKGRMMEDIVLLESKIALKDKRVFKLQFLTGEYDMVIADDNTLTCEIYEIKHTKEINEHQYRHLIDKVKLEQTEFRYGKITRKAVIYRGETKIFNNINYINVEEYLKNLYKS